ncbi:MAG TPA: bifunctional precorrin-2 dehydrogenase/sirohydrochlorin ferrochelatase [Bacillota bacterium]|nr:bifunctional precorrin-2 dehydrogenase/sirohydrochlorin ferrochelatase [Bacillota bacterium]
MGHGYPVFLNLTGQSCVVIGGGFVAERKVRSLLESGACVTVVAPQATPWLTEACQHKKVRLITRAFQPEDIDRPFLVVAATDDLETNRQVADYCLNHGVLVNVADDPEKSSFIVPAVVRRGPLAIAVSTDGNSPYLARKIRQHLEEEFGPEYEEFLRLMGSLRKEIIASVENIEDRQQVIRKLVDSDILQLIGRGDSETVKERINYVLGSSGIKP